MAGCTSRRTSPIGGGTRPSRIGLLDNRIASQSCRAGGAQSCPRRRTPQRTPQPARLSGGGACWSTWTNPTLAARTPSLVHVDQGAPRRTLIDRLVHHSEIISIEGESYRKREVEADKKVTATRRRKRRS